MKITFVTGNDSKWNSALRLISNSEIKLERSKIELDEIQSQNGEEIAIHSVKEAFEKLQRPVVVTDTSWLIETLNGFPGPYAKDIQKWLNEKDFLNLMKDKTNRTVKVIEYLAYFDGKKIKIIKGEIKGTITLQIRGERGTCFDKIVLLNGEKRTPAEMSEEENNKLWTKLKLWQQLIQYLKEE